MADPSKLQTKTTQLEKYPTTNVQEKNAADNAEDGDSAEEENNGKESGDGEESPPEIKLETAPNDARFPFTNQTRHCFARYLEYHMCKDKKGEGAVECEPFAKYYRSLCPMDWIERWNEQRANGTFPWPP